MADGFVAAAGSVGETVAAGAASVGGTVATGAGVAVALTVGLGVGVLMRTMPRRRRCGCLEWGSE